MTTGNTTDASNTNNNNGATANGATANEVTIVAPMTPMIPAAIIGVRISGTHALQALALFQPHRTKNNVHINSNNKHGNAGTAKPATTWQPEPRKSIYAVFHSTVSDVCDDVVLTYYAAPNSYSGEDTVEVFFHGNPMIAQAAMDSLLAMEIQGGRRMQLAEGGEFTKRAFLNGRITLSEAEAVNDLIHAVSLPALKNSYNRMHGATRKGVDGIIASMIELSSSVEALIEFPDDVGDGEQDFLDIRKRLIDLQHTLENLVAVYDQTRFVQTGLKVAIVGKPNVGKSSLMNKMLGYDRAIVSDQAGTTRDFITEQMHIAGVPVAFIDTAGIRNTTNKIELAGINATHQQLKQCHLAIALFDTSQPIDQYDKELAQMVKHQPHLLIGNKSDLKPQTTHTHTDNHIQYHASISLAGNCLSYRKVIKLIEEFLQKGVHEYQQNIISSSRERNAFDNSAKLIAEVVNMVQESSIDLVAFELQTIKNELAKITGKNYTDQILNNIFANFCIGK